MKKEILELLKLVSDANTHLLQLKTLIAMIQILVETDRRYDTLLIIAKTTLNGHYDYRLYVDPMFQDPKYHIDNYIDKKQLKRGYITAVDDINDINISYD